MQSPPDAGGLLVALRYANNLLSSTPVAAVPHKVPALVTALANCPHPISASQAGTNAAGTEVGFALHKFRTGITTLLQGRHVEGQWAAAVLIKAAIENPALPFLQESLPWVRGLLSLLSVRDTSFSMKHTLVFSKRASMMVDKECASRSPALPLSRPHASSRSRGSCSSVEATQSSRGSFYRRMCQHSSQPA